MRADQMPRQQGSEEFVAPKVAHSPTPWIELEMPAGCNDRITTDDGEGTLICEFPYALDANSAFIVRACNVHHDLIAELKAAREELGELVQCRHSSDLCNCNEHCRLRNIDAALAKAGAA